MILLSEGPEMPTVVIEGRFRFVINTRENLFEPPHVHVWVDNEDTCRISLLSGNFLERPPPGTRREIMIAYRRHSAVIHEIWESIHGN